MKISIDPQVEELIESLEDQTIAKVLRSIDLLEKFGHLLTMPHAKKIAKNLFELRITGRQEIRIFYAFHQGVIKLLHAFIKKQQKTPRRELETALAKLSRLT